MKLEKNVWVIMSKDRKHIAVGVPRNRSLVPIEDAHKQRILDYQSEGKARAGFTSAGFYGQNELLKAAGLDWGDDLDMILEAVPAKITIEVPDSKI